MRQNLPRSSSPTSAPSARRSSLLALLLLPALGGCVMITDGQRDDRQVVWRKIEREQEKREYCNSSPASSDPLASMIEIPAGSYMLGSPANQAGAQEDESEHVVNLTKAYEISQLEVTQEQYESLVGLNPSEFQYCKNNPVDTLSWHDAANFTNLLNSSLGLQACYECQVAGETTYCVSYANPYLCAGYRLPTEAEWELAARAATVSSYQNGADWVPATGRGCEAEAILSDDSELGSFAWYCWNSNEKTHPVGMLDPNAWGLYDVSGNVAEWVHDGYTSFPEDSTDPYGDPASISAILRGGSYYDEPAELRLGSREPISRSRSLWEYGLRIARSLP